MIAVELYTHAYRHEECGRIAFYLTHRPHKSDPLSSQSAYLLSGDHPGFCSELRCGSCGEYIREHPMVASVVALAVDGSVISKKWEGDSLQWRGAVLTGIHRHWCPDWDFLPLDETSPEWPCACYQKNRPGTFMERIEDTL